MRNQRTWARVSLEETDIEDSFRIGQVQPCEVRLVYLRVCYENRISRTYKPILFQSSFMTSLLL